MKRILFIFTLVLVVSVFAAEPAKAAQVTPSEIAPQHLITDLYTTFMSLSGIAMLISAIVNALKKFHLVTDEAAPGWVMALNLAGLVLLGIAQLTDQSELVPVLDQQAGSIATVITVIVGYVYQLWVSRMTHQNVLAGLPVVGKSFSGRVAGEAGIVVDIDPMK